MNSGRDRGLFPQSYFRFLAVCQGLGITLVEATRTFLSSYRLSPPVQEDLTILQRRLEAGTSLAEALPAVRQVPEWAALLLKWSEKGNQMSESLRGLAGILDLDARILKNLRLKFVYPVVLSTAGLILAILMASVAPLEMFASSEFFGGPLVETNGLNEDRPAIVTPDQLFPAPLAMVSGIWRVIAAIPSEIQMLALGGWLCMLLLIYVPGLTGSDRANRTLQNLIPGGRRPAELARTAFQARILATSLEAAVPMDEAVEMAAAASASQKTALELKAVARELKAGSKVLAAFQKEVSPGSPALCLGPALAWSAPIPGLLSLAQELGERAEECLEDQGRALIPVIYMITILLAALPPVGQMASLIRLTVNAAGIA